MIALHDVCYVRLGTRDLDTAARFATEVLGLEIAERGRRSLHLRSDARAHTLFYGEGDPAEQVVGFELCRQEELEAAGAALEALGHPVRRGMAAECAERRVKEFLAFRDPSGNAIELAWRPEQGPGRYRGARDAGITGFSHIGLCSSNPARDEGFWTEVCNARVSDRIGNAPLLRIGQVHHAIALFPSPRPGIQHVNHQVESGDDVMGSFHLLRERGVPVVFGPGRHPSSSARFLYFEGPDGMIFEYSCGVRLIADELLYRERQFPFANPGFCQWGAVPRIREFQ